MADNQDFYDNQNYDVDIEKVYNDFISEIDAIRSHTNLVDIKTALDLNNHALKLKQDVFPQESRCHAFYRLIGLPVCSSSGGIYSPGFSASEKSEKLDAKKTVANGISTNLYKLMTEREQFNSSIKKFFALQDIQSSALALASKNIRKFVDPLGDDSDPFAEKSVSYTVNKKDGDVDLTTLIDENKEKIDASSQALSLGKVRRHPLKPFIVNPIIDLTVYPAEKRIAVPFVEKYVETKIANEKFLRRPYIEYVCRIRFNGKNNKDSLSEAQTQLINDLKSSETLKDATIIQSVSNDFKTTEKEQFLKLYNILRAILKQLYNATSKIKEVSSETFWVPIPDKNGPEFGCTTRNIIAGDPNNKTNNKNDDTEIADKQLIDNFIKFNTKTLNVKVVSINRFAFEKVQITPDDSSGFGNVNSDDLEHLLSVRNAKCNEANNSLRLIEIVMGEFSGLGLSDIMAVYGALWLLDKKYLVGLLDEDAYNRMKLVPELKNDPDLNSRADANTSIKEFEKKVKEIFELMDKLYEDISSRNLNI